MFLARSSVKEREDEVRSFLSSHPSVALVLAAVNFEWTVSRAVLFLSTTANVPLRQKMRDYHSPKRYNELWRHEVMQNGHPALAKLVRNWASVLKGFDARNVLVHGKDRHTTRMVTPKVQALLKGACYVDTYCRDIGKPLYGPMPKRRKSAV